MQLSRRENRTCLQLQSTASHKGARGIAVDANLRRRMKRKLGMARNATVRGETGFRSFLGQVFFKQCQRVKQWLFEV